MESPQWAYKLGGNNAKQIHCADTIIIRSITAITATPAILSHPLAIFHSCRILFAVSAPDPEDASCSL